MDMIERVARAMASAAGCDPDDPVSGSAGVSTSGFVYTAIYRRRWQEEVARARAAITAMRELTQNQLDAVSGTEEQDEDAKWLWSTMIDAALGGNTDAA